MCGGAPGGRDLGPAPRGGSLGAPLGAARWGKASLDSVAQLGRGVPASTVLELPKEEAPCFRGAPGGAPRLKPRPAEMLAWRAVRRAEIWGQAHISHNVIGTRRRCSVGLPKGVS